MNTAGILNVMALITGVAMVTTVVSRTSSAAVIRSVGEAFSGSLRAAMGN